MQDTYVAELISKDDLHALKNELIIAERINEDKVQPQMRQGIERYLGRYVPSIANNWDILLNEIYPIIQYEIPSIYFRNPRAFLKPRNKNFIYKKRNPLTGEMEQIVGDSSKSAKTQEALLNYTLSEIRYKQEVQKVLIDALIFKHGVLWHGYKGDFGMTEERSYYIQDERMFVQRISPSSFLFDPTVTLATLDEARWIARRFEVPLRDIQEDDQLDVEKSLKGKQGFNTVLDMDKPQPIGDGGMDMKMLGSRTRTLLDYTDDHYRNMTASRFVNCYEIIRRPSKKEKREGKKGQVILYTPEQQKPLRINPWNVKAEGWPAQVLQLNYVPDQIFGISDLEVFGEIADHKNMIINLQLRNAQANSKVMIFFDKTMIDPETVKKIEEGEQNIIGVEGVTTGKLSIVSPGGQASGELYLIDGRIQQNLDEKSGINNIKKGVLQSGEESKYSVQQRMAGSNVRPAYRQDQMADFLKASLHYLNQLNKQFLPYDEAVRIMGSLDIEWSDNPSKEEIQADTDVELDVISMQPENPEKEVEELQLILKLAFDALTNPSIMQKIQQEGKTFNVSPIIESLLLRLKQRDPEVFRSIRPEESMGFASVSELKAAQANVAASVQGQPPPSPPAQGQDHAARLEVYSSVQTLLKEMGHMSEILEQLIMTQQAIAEEEAQKEAPKTGSTLKAPSMVSA